MAFKWMTIAYLDENEFLRFQAIATWLKKRPRKYQIKEKYIINN